MTNLCKDAGCGVKRMVKLAISLLFYMGNWLWCRVRQMTGGQLRGTCVVLFYHAVPVDQRSKFARQMDILSRWARPVRCDIRKPLDKGCHHAAIVFHDAFVSVCENALPELAQRRIPSTLFVPTGYVGRFAGWMMDDGCLDSTEVVVDVDRLKSFDNELVSIGSHGVTHTDFSILSEDEARSELRKSKLELEAIIGRPVRLFAFPYGEFGEALVEWCKEAGYQRVFTILPKLAFSDPKEYVTGSYDVSPSDWSLEFKLKLLGAYRWLPPVYALKRGTKLMLGRRGYGTRTAKPSKEAAAANTQSGQVRYAPHSQEKVWNEASAPEARVGD